MKPRGLSGFTVTKNCIERDYCLRECVESMLLVCDEVVVGDMGSTDETIPLLLEWFKHEPKLRIVHIPDWTSAKADNKWYVSALNDCREHLAYDTMLQLDADEVLSDDPDTLAYVRSAVEKRDAFAFNRLNFVRDARSLIPENECCGKFVVRIGPSHLWLPSDEPHPRGECHILDMSYHRPDAFIFHLGFLRRPEAFYKKARVVLGAFFGNYDQRLADAEATGKDPMSGMPWYDRLVPYNGSYPKAVREWLVARGYEVP